MTRRAAITGYPVSHSRSPLIHNHWLALHGIDGTYERIAVAPEEAHCFYESLGDQGLIGCNVTVPNKEVAVEVCATLDEAARAMGAVNLLWVEGDGRVHGANTDGLGFLGNLDPGPANISPLPVRLGGLIELANDLSCLRRLTCLSKGFRACFADGPLSIRFRRVHGVSKRQYFFASLLFQ